MASVICLFYCSQISFFFFVFGKLPGAVGAQEPTKATVVCQFSAVILPVIDTFGLMLTVIKSSVFSPFFLPNVECQDAFVRPKSIR